MIEIIAGIIIRVCVISVVFYKAYCETGIWTLISLVLLMVITEYNFYLTRKKRK